MTKLTNMFAVALVSMSALVAVAVTAASHSNVPTVRNKPTVHQPRWVEIEAEPVYSDPAPLKAKAKAKAPLKAKAKAKAQSSQVTYTLLEQGGSPTAEYVARID